MVLEPEVTAAMGPPRQEAEVVEAAAGEALFLSKQQQALLIAACYE